MLFDKDGILSKKESLDQEIEDLILENENLTRKIRESQNKIVSHREDLDGTKSAIVELEKKQLESKSRLENQMKEISTLLERISEVSKRIESNKEQEIVIRGKREGLEKEVEALEKEIEESYQEFLSMSKMLESEKEALQKLLEDIQSNQSQYLKKPRGFPKSTSTSFGKGKNLIGIKGPNRFLS